MRKLTLYILLCALTIATVRPLVAQAQAQEKPPMKLKVGDMAPDFTVKYYDGKKLQDISLKDFRGKKNVVLAFFVFAFTGG